ncbi:ATP-binding cassette domain-containing protein [Propioniciclava tarda]|nr:ATP-binding cassette domain-containing protein [Propioniciclava tarda]SMO51642.1 ABC transporter [Propioniciclava tarda]
MTADKEMFAAVGLTRVFGRGAGRVLALEGVDLTVRRGERLGVVGESGSGKSTLIRLLAALDTPTAGSVSFEGQPVTGRPERELGFLRRRVQIVFQDPRASLDPRMKVRRIITEPLRSPMIRAELGDLDPDARVRELMEAVGLDYADADRYPHEFSGGQRQRIAIARALAPKPHVLIADEPVSALDVSVRAQVLNLLDDLVDRFGLTMIFVSHDLRVVRHVCSRAIVMRQGRIVESAPTASLFSDPQTDYTRALLAAIPAFRGA